MQHLTTWLQALGNMSDAQDCVAKLCCTWWERGAAGRDSLVAQTLPYIVVSKQQHCLRRGSCPTEAAVLPKQLAPYNAFIKGPRAGTNPFSTCVLSGSG